MQQSVTLSACRDAKAKQRWRLAQDLASGREDPLLAECASRLVDRLRDVIKTFSSCLVLGGGGASALLHICYAAQFRHHVHLRKPSVHKLDQTSLACSGLPLLCQDWPRLAK